MQHDGVHGWFQRERVVTVFVGPAAGPTKVRGVGTAKVAGVS